MREEGTLCIQQHINTAQGGNAAARSIPDYRTKFSPDGQLLIFVQVKQEELH